VVTKSDLTAAARRARADIEGALGLAESPAVAWTVPVMLLSAARREGVEALADAIERHRLWLAGTGEGGRMRALQARHWLEDSVREQFGLRGLQRAKQALSAPSGLSPFRRAADISKSLESRD